MFSPEQSVNAGYLRQVVAPNELASGLQVAVDRLKTINLDAYAGTKQLLHEGVLAEIDHELAALLAQEIES